MLKMKGHFKTLLITKLLILLLLSVSIYAQQNESIQHLNTSDIEILYVGDYKKGEFDIKLVNREWWGLYKVNKRLYIKKIKLVIEKIEPDIQYDWEYRVSVQNNKNCITLISGLDLNERDIDFFTANDYLRNNQDLTFEFGPYQTYISSKLKTEKQIGKIKTYSIQLNYRYDEKLNTQELFTFPCFDDKLHIKIEWAGDLDNDGKTDFMIQIPTLPNNEIGYSTGLFLSSKSTLNELVKLVAVHTQSGC